ncbi:MAG: amidase [Deltaproteobacteria bacterium]|nr:amidase [Deltaproteobacteria bacterium]
MTPSELANLDATAQADLVRRREATPRELVDAAIARLEAVNPRINAVIHLQLDDARARAADPKLPDGPFQGVPFLMKDIGGPEAGQPNHAGSRVLKEIGYRETTDGYLTQKIKAAGLVTLGRTNTPELALLPTTEPDAYGPTRNPWNLDHSAGGSSGGAAAAVAAGIVPFAHASDGGGSIRGPGSMCGLIGLKPTRGRCSFGPAVGERWSGFSNEFAMTRSIRDTAALLDAVAGGMPGDPYTAPPATRSFAESAQRPPGKLRVAMLRHGIRGVDLHPECVAAVDRAARLLADAGHVVEEAYPAILDDPEHVGHYVTIVASNTARAVDVWAERAGRTMTEDDMEPLTWALVGFGRAKTAPDLLASLESVQRFGRRIAEWFTGGWDLLLTATQSAPPPRIGEISSTREEPLRAFLRAAPYGVNTLPFNQSGMPAISLPVHWTADGLPVGAQLVAPFAREDLLLAVGAQLEQAGDWTRRRAPVHA